MKTRTTADHEIKRIYWRVGDVAEKYGMATSKVRFWDEEFKLSSARDRKGNRLFIEKDLEKFHLVYNLAEKLRFTLEGAKAIIEVLNDTGNLDSQVMHGALYHINEILLKRQYERKTKKVPGGERQEDVRGTEKGPGGEAPQEAVHE